VVVVETGVKRGTTQPEAGLLQVSKDPLRDCRYADIQRLSLGVVKVVASEDVEPTGAIEVETKLAFGSITAAG
jgi:hypothetical protein